METSAQYSRLKMLAETSKLYISTNIFSSKA